MDALSNLLKHLRLSSAVYFHEAFSAPWGMQIPEGPYAQFHLLSEGNCLLLYKGKTLELSAGDILLFPTGAAHQLKDAKASRSMEGQELLSLIQAGNSPFGGPQENIRLLCGHFEFDKNTDHPFLHELPDIILLSVKKEQEHNKLEIIAKLIIQETEREDPGSELVVRKLAEILFVHCIRLYAYQQKHKQGFLASLHNPQISQALKLIHELPEKGWTLEKLSKEAGMSRTSFAIKFREQIGITPHNYLTDWRMLKARSLLLESKEPIAAIAELVGYKSEAAFSKVFKKRTQLSPSRFRLTNSFS